MIFYSISSTDLGIIAAVVVVIIVVIYRLLRRDPIDRIVRLGMFIERKRFGDADNGKPESPSTPPPLPPPPASEKTTEEHKWPTSGT